MRGSGIGKLWIAEDAFSPETDLEIQKLFEGDPNDPRFDIQPRRRLTRKKKSA
jgi:hypothetical protein